MGILKLLKRFTLGLFLGLLLFFVAPRSVNALSGSEFNAGRIIDDSVFFNSNSMSVGEIQSFLNSKVDCDFDGSEMVGGITRARYAADRGYPTTFTCLPQYKENPTTRENNIGNPNATPSGAISAAQIIYNVSAAQGVSSKALIVLLQKEQALVTDEWPVPRQYQIATGYGCPDTAPCDEQYYGFYNQVNKAAYQFKRYVTNSGSYRYKSGQVNSIYWSPTTSCGASNVYIENGATAALYNYTPYRPNQAALNNLYGTGDGCSAYGNRNFWRYFRDWFGSVNSNYNPSAEFHSMSAYPTVEAGKSAEVYIRYKNASSYQSYSDAQGSAPGQSPLVLANTNPINRSSDMVGSGWASSSRPAVNFSAVYEANGTTLAANQHVVQPGQIYEFKYVYSPDISKAAGSYREWIQPVLEGAPNWNIGATGFFDVNVTAPEYGAKFNRMSSYPTVQRGSSSDVWIDYQNVGTNPWYDDVSVPSGQKPIHLANTNPINRPSDMSTSGWLNNNRPSGVFSAVYEANGTTLAANQHVVQKGQIARFAFRYSIPGGKALGTHREWIQPVLEGAVNWSIGGVGFFDISVTAPEYGAKYHRLSGYPSIARGSSATVSIDYQNVGTNPWYDDVSVPSGQKPIHLANTNPINRPSDMSTSGWLNNNRPSGVFSAVYEANGTTLAANQHVVQPGQIVRFAYSYSAPGSKPTGLYREWIQPVLEGASNWNLGAAGFFDINVTTP